MAHPCVYNCGRSCIRLASKQIAVLHQRLVSRIPENIVNGSREGPTCTTSRCTKRNLRYRVSRTEEFIHERPNTMDILIANLHKDGTTFRQQIARHRQSIAQIRQIRVNPVPPSVPERLHLLGLATDVLRLPVLHIPACRRPLEVRVELDAVRRVEIDALHLAAQPFALGERRHHLKTVAEDYPVRPVGVVLIELGAGVFARQAVEVGEKVDLKTRLARKPLRLRRLAVSQQVVDQRLRMHLLLDEERRRLYHQVRPVLLVLAAPEAA